MYITSTVLSHRGRRGRNDAENALMRQIDLKALRRSHVSRGRVAPEVALPFEVYALKVSAGNHSLRNPVETQHAQTLLISPDVILLLGIPLM